MAASHVLCGLSLFLLLCGVCSLPSGYILAKLFGRFVSAVPRAAAAFIAPMGGRAFLHMELTGM